MRPGNARCNETKGFWSGFWAIVLTPKKGLYGRAWLGFYGFLLVDLIRGKPKKERRLQRKNTNTVSNYNHMNNISKLLVALMFPMNGFFPW